MAARREHWSSRLGFILATVGSAVGLGSIWKFPYEVGSNGGGAFVLFYVVGIVAIVVPLMLAEFAIGRHGRADTAGSIAAVAHANGASRHWALVGVLGVAASFLILSFYSVVGGWALAYAVGVVADSAPVADVRSAQARFDALLASPLRLAAYHAVFMAVTIAIVARGIAGGIETASKILMPVLMVLITTLAAYSALAGDVAATLRYLFAVDPATVTPRVALEALGLGFFSIGVGLGVMIAYAAYAEREIDLAQVAVVTIVGDTAISFLAGFAVFPVVFAEGLDPSSGPGLMFVTLPLAFVRMPFGAAAALAFFLLLVVAALASAISLLEMPVALLRRLGWQRPAAAILAGLSCWFVGLATVLSFNLWSEWHPLARLPGFARANVYDLIDQLTSNVMLPLGGLLLAIFAGWALPARLLASELRLSARAIKLLRLALRYLVPLGIAAAALAPVIL